jgi:hypothetical protein
MSASYFMQHLGLFIITSKKALVEIFDIIKENRLKKFRVQNLLN